MNCTHSYFFACVFNSMSDILTTLQNISDSLSISTNFILKKHIKVNGRQCHILFTTDHNCIGGSIKVYRREQGQPRNEYGKGRHFSKPSQLAVRHPHTYHSPARPLQRDSSLVQLLFFITTHQEAYLAVSI